MCADSLLNCARFVIQKNMEHLHKHEKPYSPNWIFDFSLIQKCNNRILEFVVTFNRKSGFIVMELFSKMIDLLEPLVISENESLYESSIDCECPISLLCKAVVEVITTFGSLDDSLLFILKKVYKELDNPLDRLKKRLISEQLFIIDYLLMYFDHENSIFFTKHRIARFRLPFRQTFECELGI
jgi:hypothetical protein